MFSVESAQHLSHVNFKYQAQWKVIRFEERILLLGKCLTELLYWTISAVNIEVHKLKYPTWNTSLFNFTPSINSWATSWENLSCAICEHQRCRSAWASARSDHLWMPYPKFQDYLSSAAEQASFESYLVVHLQRQVSLDMTKPTKWVCTQRRLRHEGQVKTDQTGRMPRLIWVFPGRTLILLVLSCRGSDFLVTWLT